MTGISSSLKHVCQGFISSVKFFMRPVFFIAITFIFSPFVFYGQDNKTGWTDLFDGKSLKGWKKLAGTADYAVENGMIVGTTVPHSPNTFLVTEKEYGDFVLELEVKIDDSTSNSGIQFRSHFDPNGNSGKGKVYGYQYELDPSARRWTGGVYDEGRRDWLYPMMLHASAQHAFTPGAFNKVKIECIGNTIKTWVNGVAAAYVVDTADREGFIALQVHSISRPEQAGEKIYWKNIRIRTKDIVPASFPRDIYVVNTIPNYLSGFEKGSGWKLLFDGRTGNGWVKAYEDGFPAGRWIVKDGTLSLPPAADGKPFSADIVTRETFSAFDLSFEFRLTPGANSGIKYFVTLEEKNTGGAGIGLEYQLLDDSLHPDAKMGRDGNRTLASLYDLIKAQKTTRFIKQPGSWNTGRIVVYPNNHVEHYLNGIKVLEYERGSASYRGLVAISKYTVYPGFGEAKAGHILLQDHGDGVSFRSIRIRRLN